MKKIISAFMAIAMLFSLAVPTFAAQEKNTTWEVDLTKITGESTVIYEGIEQTEDFLIKTTVTASRPIYNARSSEGETTVTTTKDLYSSSAGTYYGYVTLTTDFWFNSLKNTAGWSSATVEKEITDGPNIKILRANTPKGTTGTSFGTKWVKVTSNWYSENTFGVGTSGNIWNKITSKGVLSNSK